MVTFILLYLLGVGISARIFYKWAMEDEGQISVGDFRIGLYSLLSWLMVIVQIIIWFDDNKNKVLYKPKNKKNGLGKDR